MNLDPAAGVQSSSLHCFLVHVCLVFGLSLGSAPLLTTVSDLIGISLVTVMSVVETIIRKICSSSHQVVAYMILGVDPNGITVNEG